MLKQEKINKYDWTDYLRFNDSDLIQGCINNANQKSIKILKDAKKVEIFLNKENLKIAQSLGIIFDGLSFLVTEVHISGPRVTQISPLVINRSNSEQDFFLYFTEKASVLNGKIFFENFYYNMNKQINCKVAKDNNKKMVCKGIFNFTGEFYLKDDKGYNLFSNRFLTVVAKEQYKPNINNLLDNHVLFDDEKFDKKIYLSKDLFKEMNSDSELTIEIEDLHYPKTYQILYIYKGTSNTLIKFDGKDANTTINKNGSLVIPPAPSRELIKISLKNNYKIFKDEGISINGYGFLLRSVYFNEKIESDGISGWGVFLIVFLCIVVLCCGAFLFIRFRKRMGRLNIENELLKF